MDEPLSPPTTGSGCGLGPSSTADPGDFVAVMLRHQRQVYAFIGTLIPERIDLDDVYQQTCLVIWQNRSQYDATRPFLPWAYAFARNAVFNHIRREGRGGLHLSTELLERIAMVREQGDPTAEARRAALERCVQKLPAAQRDLIRRRYAGDAALKDMAAEMSTTAAALTMRLQRIRHALLRCIENALVDGGPA